MLLSKQHKAQIGMVYHKCRGLWFYLCLAIIVSSPVLAEEADRDKPIIIEANQIEIDDTKKIRTLLGNVTLNQGTLQLKADKVVINEDKYGFQKGIAFGSLSKPARIKQKDEESDRWLEGQATRIEYNTRSGIGEFFGNAQVKSDTDEIQGDYIWLDSVTRKYAAKVNPKSPSDTRRVRVVIDPKTHQKNPKK